MVKAKVLFFVTLLTLSINLITSETGQQHNQSQGDTTSYVYQSSASQNHEDLSSLVSLSGEGTEASPYEIQSISDLKLVESNLDKHFILMQNLSFTSTDYDDATLGWEPIGDNTDPFSGSFNGNYKTIHNLFSNKTTRYTGLFGSLTGSITWLNLENVNVTGSSSVGGLVGENQGTIINSSASGSVVGNAWVGGLVGQNEASIVNSTASVSVYGNSVTGGLVGYNDASIVNSSASGSVIGNLWVGGLVGQNNAIIADSSASGSVSGNLYVGGLAGWGRTGTINNSLASGSVSGGNNVGGLVGDSDASVFKSTASGSVSGGSNIGGLVGLNRGTITVSIASGSVSGTGNFAGGLVGRNLGTIIYLQFVSSPGDISVKVDTIAQLSWTVVGLGGNYSLAQDGTIIIFNNSWLSNMKVTTDLLALSPGVYNFTIVFQNGSASIFDTVFVTIFPELSVNSPADASFKVGTTAQLNWTAAGSGGSYTLFHDGTNISVGSWIWPSNMRVTTNLPALSPGVYNFTIVVYDGSASVSDTVFATIFPGLNVNSPTDVSVKVGTNAQINWVVAGSRGSYTLFQDSTNISVGSWLWPSDMQITTDLSELSPGIYNFTILFHDGSVSVSDTAFVTIFPMLSVISPANVSFEIGTTAQISWTVAGSAGSYTLLKNGTTVADSFWSWPSKNQVTTGLSELSVGSYNFTIVVHDGKDTILDTVFITIIFPMLNVNSPADVSVTVDTLAQISWTVTGSEGSYDLFKNGTIITNENWASNMQVTTDLSELSPGIYNFTVVFHDGSDSVSDTVFVTIESTTIPPISTSASTPTSTSTSSSSSTSTSSSTSSSDQAGILMFLVVIVIVGIGLFNSVYAKANAKR